MNNRKPGILDCLFTLEVAGYSNRQAGGLQRQRGVVVEEVNGPHRLRSRWAGGHVQ